MQKANVFGPLGLCFIVMPMTLGCDDVLTPNDDGSNDGGDSAGGSGGRSGGAGGRGGNGGGGRGGMTAMGGGDGGGGTSGTPGTDDGGIDGGLGGPPDGGLDGGPMVPPDSGIMPPLTRMEICEAVCATQMDLVDCQPSGTCADELCANGAFFDDPVSFPPSGCGAQFDAYFTCLAQDVSNFVCSGPTPFVNECATTCPVEEVAYQTCFAGAPYCP